MDVEVYLDLDEVIADFVGPALEIHGASREEVEKWQESTGKWDIRTPLGLSSTDFWNPIHAVGEAFWRNLPELPWMDSLLEEVSRVTGIRRKEIFLLSSPCKGTAVHSGKAGWIHDRFGKEFNHFALTKHKERFAHSRAILIDDSRDNCTKFMERGGRIVQFPSPTWKSEFRLNPVAFVAEELRIILSSL